MIFDEKEFMMNEDFGAKFDGELISNYRLSEKLFDDFPLCMCIWDYRLDILSCNDPYAEMLKIDTKDELATRFFEMSPEKQPDGQTSSTKLLDLITQTFRTGSSKTYWVHLDSDGKEVLTQLTLKKFQEDNMKTNDVVLMYAEKLNIQKVTIDELDFENTALYDEMVYRLMLQQMPEMTQDIWFCYDIKKTNFKYFSKQDGCSKLKTINNFPNGIIKDGYIYKNDVLRFLEIIDDIHAGVNKKSDIRLNIDGEPVWHDINYEILRDKNGASSLIIGKLTSIQDYETLKSKKMLDGLTNCYNRDAFNEIISDAMSTSAFDEKHTLWMVEIFDINSINVKYGMQFTDLILIDIANQLLETLQDCIIGRVHGRFVIFKKNCHEKEEIDEKTYEIIKCFVNSYDGVGEETCETNCNIGVTTYPDQGKYLVDLYATLSTALEYSKNQGINSYAIYSEKLSELLEIELEKEEFEVTVADSMKIISSKLCIDIFNMLHTNFLEKQEKIDMVMEIITKEFKLDRCFILSNDGENYVPTSSYIREGACEEIFNKETSNIRAILKNSNEQGVLVIEDLFKEQDTYRYSGDFRALLASKIMINGQIKHLLVAETQEKVRNWSDEEINTISQISKIMSVFL